MEEADHVVPGHGAVLDAVRAAAILREDLALPRHRRAAAGPPLAGAEEDRRREPDALVIHHVSLELEEHDVAAEVAFWELLGFTEMTPPGALAERARWVSAATSSCT